MAANLPWEGADANRPRLASVADRSVPTCSLSDRVGAVRTRMGRWPLCLVVAAGDVVLGLVRAEALALEDDRPVVEVMQEGPSTYRPDVEMAEMADRLERKPAAHVIVTSSDGRLVGLATADAIHRAAGRSRS